MTDDELFEEIYKVCRETIEAVYKAKVKWEILQGAYEEHIDRLELQIEKLRKEAA